MWARGEATVPWWLVPARWHEPSAAWQRYAAAILVTLSCVLLRLLLTPLVGHEVPLVLFYLGVVTSSWIGGLGPGLLSAVLGLAFGVYMFMNPAGSWQIDLHRESVVMYILLAPATAFIVNGMRRTLHRAKSAEASLLESQRRLHVYADQLEERVQERTRDLEASLSSIEELLYTIAHDLRAPNRAMQAYSEILASDYGQQLDDTARDYLRRIGSSALRSDALINDLLDYGKLSHQHLSLESVDPGAVVQKVSKRFAAAMQQRGGSFRLGADWPAVTADAALLEQAMEELLDNAIKHVPAGTAPIVTVSARRRDSTVVLSVCDNGPGIPPSLRSRVFAPFIRLNDGSPDGTGIGLAIVRKAIERMAGSVTVSAAKPGGACFEVTLPAAEQV